MKAIIIILALMLLVSGAQAADPTIYKAGFKLWNSGIDMFGQNLTNITKPYSYQIYPCTGGLICADNGSTGAVDLKNSDFATVFNSNLIRGTVAINGQFTTGTRLDLKEGMELYGVGNRSSLTATSNIDLIYANGVGNIKIHDLNIITFKGGTGDGIRLNNSNRNKIYNLNISHRSDDAISLANSSDNEVFSNIIDGDYAGTNGIQDKFLSLSGIPGYGRNIISKNIITNMTDHGIWFNGFDNKIISNYVFNTGGEMIESQGGSNCLVSGNTVKNGSNFGYDITNVSDCTISNNIASDLVNDGIALRTDANSLQMRDNIISGNNINSARIGILVVGNYNNTIIAENIAKNNTQSGMQITGWNTTIYGNILENNSIGTLGSYPGIRLYEGSKYNKIYLNSFNGTAQGAAVGETAGSDYNIIKDNFIYTSTTLVLVGGSTVAVDNYGASPFNFGSHSTNVSAFGAGDTFYNSTKGAWCEATGAGLSNWHYLGNASWAKTSWC